MMHRRDLLVMSALTGASAFMGWKSLAQAAGGPRDLGDPAMFQKMADRIRHLFTPKPEPQAGDWLDAHREPGQTFAQYAGTNPNRPKGGRTALYLVELGKFGAPQRNVIRLLREYMGLVFGLEVKSLPAIDLSTIPDSARREASGGTQILSTHVLDKTLMPMRPADAVALLALTPIDLWPGEGWNFVFGHASLRERVGVWSTARFGDPVKNAQPFLRRVLQVAVHETGHMFGMEHCVKYECGMNGSNSLAESDRAPLPFCAECEAKLWWVCRQKPAQRATSLADFADRNGFKSEAAHWRAEAKALAD